MAPQHQLISTQEADPEIRHSFIWLQSVHNGQPAFGKGVPSSPFNELMEVNVMPGSSTID